jgi:hypothetical protein
MKQKREAKPMIADFIRNNSIEIALVVILIVTFALGMLVVFAGVRYDHLSEQLCADQWDKYVYEVSHRCLRYFSR